jgi:hypothetical protein
MIASVIVPIAPTVHAWTPPLIGTAPGKESGPADDEKAKRHEGIADMQNQDEPVAQGPIAGPPSQPDSLDDRREEQDWPPSAAIGER